MTTLLLLTAALLLGQWLSGRRARRDATRLMRPADEWEAEDLDRWLALIEPFPLRKPTHDRKR
jgi:hypothetical protein